jgi:hypothetical protein
VPVTWSPSVRRMVSGSLTVQASTLHTTGTRGEFMDNLPGCIDICDIHICHGSKFPHAVLFATDESCHTAFGSLSSLLHGASTLIRYLTKSRYSSRVSKCLSFANVFTP